MIVVADAGPLVHLHWVGASEWALPTTAIHVVEAVWVEVERHEPRALSCDRLVRVGTPSSEARAKVVALTLDPGETDAIAYALSSRAPTLVLCDERAARRACNELGLAVVGSIGLIVEASRAGRVDRPLAVEVLRALPTRGRMHVAPALVERAVAML